MYKEAMELLPILYETRNINAYSLSIAELVMRNSLGMDTSNCAKHTQRIDYVKRQILDYSDDAALKHLENHIETNNVSKRAYFIIFGIGVIGATGLSLIALVPSFASYVTNITTLQGIGATSLIIMVGVALDFINQIKTHLLARNYESFLKNG